MKLLLSLAFCFLAAEAFAQVPKQMPPRTVPSPDSLRNFKGDNGEMLRKQFEEYLQRRKLQSQLLGDKQGNIAHLPQDHMPCVVPDSASAGLMPNAWSPVTVPFRPQLHVMPNPALPKQPSLEKGKGENNDQTK